MIHDYDQKKLQNWLSFYSIMDKQMIKLM